MSRSSTIRLERTTPRTARITFANPPMNLVVSETVVALHEIVRELDNDPGPARWLWVPWSPTRAWTSNTGSANTSA